MVKFITHNRLRDQMGNADIPRVSTATHAIFDALQARKGLLPGETLAAITAAFVLAVKASGLPSYDLITMARNIMADANGRRVEFQAAMDYLKEEVLRRD